MKTKMKTYTFRIDKKDLANLKKIAKEKDRSISNLIRMAVRALILNWQSDKSEEK